MGSKTDHIVTISTGGRASESGGVKEEPPRGEFFAVL